MTLATTYRGRLLIWCAGLVLLVGTGGFAWSRVGMLNLPSTPSGLTLDASGLANLTAMARLDRCLRGGVRNGGTVDTVCDATGWPAETQAAMALVRDGIAAIDRGDEAVGLTMMRDGVRTAPTNLVLANAYRMATFRLKRSFLHQANQAGSLTPEFPDHLRGEPIALFVELEQSASSRETKLSLALSWVDHMLLFPALEIKAPASVEAVDVLSSVIDEGDPGYVPALFARGLNHLHRPARLVWPESRRTPKDAAVRDIGTCVAVGREFGVGSARLQATLAMTLGDAYVKAGQFNVARSWWQIAQNLCGDDDIRASILRRYGWRDEEIVDRLEEELDRARAALDRPMTDLAMMWS